MRDLAPCRIKIKSCRIKIQFIEFLCYKTGGAQIGEMAEGSQICDFREAKVDATFAKRRWMRLSRSEGGSDCREAKVDATLCER